MSEKRKKHDREFREGAVRIAGPALQEGRGFADRQVSCIMKVSLTSLMPEEAVPTARADVATTRPSRYLTQLCKHFARKVHAEYDNENGMATFEAGTCTMHARDGVLRLRAEAGDADKLSHVQAVVGNHLERFGEPDALIVQWSPMPEQRT